MIVKKVVMLNGKVKRKQLIPLDKVNGYRFFSFKSDKNNSPLTNTSINVVMQTSDDKYYYLGVNMRSVYAQKEKINEQSILTFISNRDKQLTKEL